MTSGKPLNHVWVAAIYGPHPQPAHAVRPAVILRERIYHRQPRNGGDVPGYDVRYTDATEQWHCHGGWVRADMVWPREEVG